MLVAFYFFLALGIPGIGLLAWAFLNPRWQSADSFDAILPYIVGGTLLVCGLIAGLVSFGMWFMGHWHA